MDDIVGPCGPAPPARSATPSTGTRQRERGRPGARRRRSRSPRTAPTASPARSRSWTHDGDDVARNEGASREHYSLCRCGHSQNKPFCSGMHYYVGFRDPQPDPEHEPTLFEWAGGLPALRRMTRLFYEKYVPQDPLLTPLFADMSPDHPERVAAWLGEVFGGPRPTASATAATSGWSPSTWARRSPKTSAPAGSSSCARSADEAGLPADAEWRAAFTAYLEWGSRIAVENSTTGANPPPHMPVPRWWWVCDATPGARVSALAAEEPRRSSR